MDYDDWYDRHKTEFKCAEAKINAKSILITVVFALILYIGTR